MSGAPTLSAAPQWGPGLIKNCRKPKMMKRTSNKRTPPSITVQIVDLFFTLESRLQSPHSLNQMYPINKTSPMSTFPIVHTVYDIGLLTAAAPTSSQQLALRLDPDPPLS